jgi:hypothetical protein
MTLPFPMAIGSHFLVSDPVGEWRVEFSDTLPPSVVLTASMLTPPSPPASPSPAPWATTLAVQMDSLVAMKLYEQLGELGRSMGWLPQQ